MSFQNNGRYVRFEPKYNNANEVISADHINQLQSTSERTQEGIFEAGNRDFLDKALFVLEHHRVVNGMWLDVFDDTSKIDIQRTNNLVFSERERGVVFPDSSEAYEGWLYSKPYINPNQSNMKQVMLIATAYIPNGTNIQIEVSNNGADWYDAPISDSDLFEIPSDGNRLILRARFTRSSSDVSPRLDAWAVLFRDPKNEVITLQDGREVIIGVPQESGGNEGKEGNNEYRTINIYHHQLMGIGPNDHHDQEHSHDGKDGSGRVKHSNLIEIGEDDHHPKDHQHGQDGVSPVNLTSDVIGTLGIEHLSYQLWTGRPGSTGLYFDPNIDDKLVYVKTPDDETYLFYDLETDRLSHTITITQGIAVREEMIFSDYINQRGETTVILQGTEKTHYDASDPMIQLEIQKIAAPAKPKGLLATDMGTGNEVQLTWMQNTEHDLVGYNIYRSSDGGTTWILCNVSGIVTAPSYLVTNLTTGAEYHFMVKAIDQTGYESLESDISVAIPTFLDTIAPNRPENVKATRVGAGSIEITWDENTEIDLANYLIYHSPTGVIGSYTLIQTIPSGISSFTHNGLLVGTSHYYYVTATDTSENESGRSIIVMENA